MIKPLELLLKGMDPSHDMDGVERTMNSLLGKNSRSKLADGALYMLSRVSKLMIRGGVYGAVGGAIGAAIIGLPISEGAKGGAGIGFAIDTVQYVARLVMVQYSD